MTDALHIEILFNSVELELARRWVFGNVPNALTVYYSRPAPCP
jgi:hypothetical protein